MRARAGQGSETITLVVLVLIGLAAPFTANPLLTALALATFVLLVGTLYRPGEPVAALIALGFQWLQASMRTIQADVLNVPISDLTDAPAEKASALSMAAVAVFAVGFTVVYRKAPRPNEESARREAGSYAPVRLFVLWMALSWLEASSVFLVPRNSGLAQPLLAALQLKWFFFFLLAYRVVTTRKDARLLLLATAMEVVVGFSGFFSGFKDVFFWLLMAYVAARRMARLAVARSALLTGTVLIVLVVFWMSVRVSYRQALNAGSGQQVVSIPVAERFSALIDLATHLDRDSVNEGFALMIERVGYVDMFALALDHVPSGVPYQEGALWWAAVRHVLQPRILFPGKPALPSDSEATHYYTGVRVASDEQGTSVSLGYVAESFIDFGIPGMFGPPLILGLTLGAACLSLLRLQRPVLCRMASVACLILTFRTLESTGPKLLGSFLMSYIVMYLWLVHGLPRALPVMTERRSVAPGLRRSAARLRSAT